jgi:hypothetical protein
MPAMNSGDSSAQSSGDGCENSNPGRSLQSLLVRFLSDEHGSWSGTPVSAFADCEGSNEQISHVGDLAVLVVLVVLS